MPALLTVPQPRALTRFGPMEPVYFDHAATTPVRPEVLEAMLPFFNASWGNVDLGLLGNLLLGSVPGVIVGSLLGAKVPEKLLRTLIALVLVAVGDRKSVV